MFVMDFDSIFATRGLVQPYTFPMNKNDNSKSGAAAEVPLHFKGRYLGIREREGWEYATRTNATGVVVVVALTAQQELILVEQFRIPVDSMVIELPAGLVGDHGDTDEPVEQAAARELWEETGYRAGDLKHLFQCPSSAGMSDETLDIFLATDLVCDGPGGGDASEDILVHVVALDKINTWLARAQQAGKALDPKIFAALYWVRQLEELDTLFPAAGK